MSPEAWLRGPVDGIPELLMPIAHSLIQAREDARVHGAALSHDRLWDRPRGAASAGFHLFHAAGALDRLMTYARGDSLADEQRAYYVLEKAGGDARLRSEELVAHFEAVIDRALDQLGRTPAASLHEARRVGAAGLPSNVLGLLFHGAEHTARHVGQLITTVKIAG